jgi:putative inorganic carbon (HCO3(-)) transporter
MELYQVPLNPNNKKLSLKDRLYKLAVLEKFNNPLGISFFLIFSLLFAVITAHFGLTAGLMVLVTLVALPVVYFVVAYPLFGIIVLIVMANLVMFIIKFGIPFPLGTLIDALEVMLILGFFIKQRRHKDYSMFKNLVSYMILAWVAYNILEVGNPAAASRLAWVFTVRTIAFVMLMYFIFLYNINSVKFIRVLIVMWLGFALIGALYGIKQEYMGFAGFEKAALAAEPGRATLYFIDGHWRKFSIYNDPVVFAYNMVLSIMLCVGLIWGPTSRWQKFVLGGLICLFAVSMIYSGTRAAFALIPAGLIMFCILIFNKKIMVFGLIATVCMLALILIPSHNPNIVRFQTAFKPGKDPSYILRQQNQEKIKPFIRTHPMGGGLGSVGVWGERFSPGSFLAKFPPDSGYVRVAVEMGTIGLILFCTLMFCILYTGINNFYLIQNAELKCYCLAMTIMIFTINVGNYPQEALVQYPTSIYFYLMVAILNKCLDLDKQINPLPVLKIAA